MELLLRYNHDAFLVKENTSQIMSIVLFAEHIDPRGQVLPTLPDLSLNDWHCTIEILPRQILLLPPDPS